MAFREMRVLHLHAHQWGISRVSRNGGNIHVHPEIPFITTGPKIKNASFSPAPLEIRDAVFREFIRLSPASNYMRNLSLNQDGCCHEGSRTTQPATAHCLEQNGSVQRLLYLKWLCERPLPRIRQISSGADVVGIPGFWQKLSGVVHIWKPRNYLMPLLVIPYKDDGLIQAC